MEPSSTVTIVTFDLLLTDVLVNSLCLHRIFTHFLVLLLSPLPLPFLILLCLFLFLFCLSCFQTFYKLIRSDTPSSFTLNLFLSPTAGLTLSTFNSPVKCAIMPDSMIGVTAISFPQSMHFTMLDPLWLVVLWIMLFVLTASFLLTAVSGGVILSMTCFQEKGSSPVPRNPLCSGLARRRCPTTEPQD